MSTSEGYETFVRNLEEVEEGVEREIQIRNTEDYRTKIVKAIIASPQTELAGSEPLWMRALVGHLLDQKPWKIKVTQVIEER